MLGLLVVLAVTIPLLIALVCNAGWHNLKVSIEQMKEKDN